METQLTFIQSFKKAFLGTEITGGEYIAFIIFTLISMFLIKLIRYENKRKQLKAQTPPVIIKFDFIYSIKDNIIDFMAAFISAFIMFRFFPSIGDKVGQIFGLTEMGDKMAYSVILGIGFQYIWHRVLNKIKI